MMVNTIYGEMEEEILEKKIGVIDNDVESTEWVEYWLDKELVHRSAHITLKEPAVALSGVGGFS